MFKMIKDLSKNSGYSCTEFAVNTQNVYRKSAIAEHRKYNKGTEYNVILISTFQDKRDVIKRISLEAAYEAIVTHLGNDFVVISTQSN